MNIWSSIEKLHYYRDSNEIKYSSLFEVQLFFIGKVVFIMN
nr:MAG TPA: hypothetical protein [Caudoviricetes sp.]